MTVQTRGKKKDLIKSARTRWSLIILTSLGAFVFALLFGSKVLHKEDKLMQKPETPQKKISLKKFETSHEIEKLVKEASKSFPGKAGIVFYDILENKVIGSNTKEEFEAASLIKIPILIEYFRQVKAGKLSPGESVVIKNSMKAGGSGSIKNLPEGSSVSYEELAGLMITKSDNTAADILINKLGMKNINSIAIELGCSATFLKRTIWDFAAIDRGMDNTATPEDMMILLRAIYEGKAVDEASSASMINILKRQENRKMIPAYLPEGVEVAHKTGELNGILHDCGIIYMEKCPYILCLLGKNIKNKDEARKFWADFSLRIYKVMQKRG
ncbi:MAG: class A beta-lactamase-related serine hydrolase [Firmicutes bacterium]|nr:class A beta-lactamase-related serine hydrolase [Bacillota bacterium]